MPEVYVGKIRQADMDSYTDIPIQSVRDTIDQLILNNQLISQLVTI